MLQQYRILFLLVAVLACAFSASASQELSMNWNQVKIVSPPVEDTGIVIFDAQTDGKAYKAVFISAFGKQFKVEGPMLSKLKGFPLNSLSITYEPGYPELGGHTVHFKMKQVHYQAKKPLEERVTISNQRRQGAGNTQRRMN